MHEISATFKQATLHIITLEVAMMDSTILMIVGIPSTAARVWDRCCPYLVSTLDLGSIRDRSDTDTDPVWALRSEIEMLITHEGEGDARREGGEKREGRKGRRKRGRKGGGDCRVKVHVGP